MTPAPRSTSSPTPNYRLGERHGFGVPASAAGWWVLITNDAPTAQDREFFSRNPHLREYRRPLIPGEFRGIERPCAFAPGTLVWVCRYPGQFQRWPVRAEGAATMASRLRLQLERGRR